MNKNKSHETALIKPSTAAHSAKPGMSVQPGKIGALPFLAFPLPDMTLFDPHDPSLVLPVGRGPSQFFYHVVRSNPQRVLIPRGEDCRALWDDYGMLDNIRAHSQTVACVALDLARLVNAAGGIHGEAAKDTVNEDLTYAAGMLHDLGKTYTIQHGGNHAQIGAAWVMRETRNGPLARSVLTHVHWPWADRLEACAKKPLYFAAMAVIYADKRVRHDEYVSIDERYEDLQARYGFTEEIRRHIESSRLQGKTLEAVFSQLIGRDLNAYTPDCGRLVR